MSETFPESSGGGAGFGGTVRKYWWVGAVALAGGLAFFWWRNRQSSGSGASTAASSGATAADASGIDYSGELSVIQSELEAVLAGQQSGAAGGGTGSGGGSGGGTGHPGGGPGSLPPPPVGLPPGAGKPPAPALPHGIRVTRTTPTQVGLAWTPVATATDYRVRVTYQGKLVSQKTARTPAITIDGLTPNHTYTFHVAASNAGGTGPETTGPAVKTPRS